MFSICNPFQHRAITLSRFLLPQYYSHFTLSTPDHIRSNYLSPHPHTFHATSEEDAQLCDMFEPIYSVYTEILCYHSSSL